MTKISISKFKINKKKLSLAYFKPSDHNFMMFLFLFITFDPILDDFLRFWTNLEIQDGGSRWPKIRNDYAIITSRDVITSSCGHRRRHFQTYYLPSKSRCHSLNILGVTVGGGGGEFSPGS